jgi:hypothetical protein
MSLDMLYECQEEEQGVEHHSNEVLNLILGWSFQKERKYGCCNKNLNGFPFIFV